MPLSIPYTYTQSSSSITLTCTLPTSASGSLSITSTNNAAGKGGISLTTTPVYLSLNCPPSSLLQLDLLHEIDDQNVKMLHNPSSHTVTLTLPKVEQGQEWSTLTVEKTMDKLTRLQRRQDSLKAAELTRASKTISSKTHQAQLNKQALESHWEIDRRQRERVLEIQNRERVVALEELGKWKKDLEGGAKEKEETKENENQDPDQATEAPELEADDEDASTKKKKKNNDIWNEEDETLDEVSSPLPPPPKSTLPPTTLPSAPIRRTSAAITISFTPDATPTRSLPARESVMAQKMAYHATQGLMTTPGADGNKVEQLPLFLKEKGDKLFSAGEFIGAISAYTQAIEGVNKSMSMNHGGNVQNTDDLLFLARCHSNRSAAEMKLGTPPPLTITTLTLSQFFESSALETRQHLKKCIADCTTALTILENASASTSSSSSSSSLTYDILLLRFKLLQRRSTTYGLLGFYTLSVEDMTEVVQTYEKVKQEQESVERMRELEGLEERKESDTTTTTPQKHTPLAPLPALNTSQLTQDRLLFTTLLDAYEKNQHLAFEAEAEKCVKDGTEDGIKKAKEALTQALLITPSSLHLLTRRATLYLHTSNSAQVAAAAAADITLAFQLWSEIYSQPKVGINAVKPGKEVGREELERVYNTPNASSLGLPQQRTPSVSALVMRIRLLHMRAAVRVTQKEYTHAQQDLAQAKMLLPLLVGGAASVNSIKSHTTSSVTYLTSYLSYNKLRTHALDLLVNDKTTKLPTAVSEMTKVVEMWSGGMKEGGESVTDQDDVSMDHIPELRVLQAKGWWNATFGSSTLPTTATLLHLYHISTLSTLLSDRSLIYLHQRSYVAAEKDASVAIQIWKEAARDVISSQQPAWYHKTLLRRGSIRAYQGKFDAAIQDYEEALKSWSVSTDNQEERKKAEADLARIKEVAANPTHN